MTSSNPDDDARTEFLHDVDYPLDVPTTSSAGAGSPETATTAFPAAGMTDFSQFSDAGGYDTAAPLPFGDQQTTPEPGRAEEISRRGTTDFALFILRVTVGVLLILRGLQKLFGLFDGPGIDGFADTLTASGFDQATALAITGGAIELVAGVMLVVGLATPIAAAGLLALVGLGLAIRLTGDDPLPLLGETTRGLETSVLYAVALFTVLFAGPGRWSADRKWGWSHRPRFSGLIWLLLAAVVAGVVWYLFNGSNPLSSLSDSGAVPAG